VRVRVLTLFPEFFASPMEATLLGKAVRSGVLQFETVQIRDFAADKHKTVDDTPFGGGSGMVMKPGPLVAALESIPKVEGQVRLLMSPRGERLTQARVRSLAQASELVLVCGRYEGVDERVTYFVDGEVSIGDFVLSGGEPAALAVIDAVARLLPGFMGNTASPEEESFSENLLEYPQYTRPLDFQGARVPQVLLSGNHAMIKRWRRTQSLRITRERRPDLLDQAALSPEDQFLLDKGE
jgi:tRNA (guanine37-N1)-methyltransferase